MVSSFTWTLFVDTGSLPPAPTGGPGVAGVPAARDPRKTQFARGVKFANVPDSNPNNITHGGPRVWHVNSVQNVMSNPTNPFTANGSVNSRFKDPRRISVPRSVSPSEYRSVDRFGNEVFSATSGSH